jgi:hypothetical protein
MHPNIQIEIRPHPQYPDTHKRVIVHSRGRVWYADWAEPWPTEATVRQAWIEDRRSFLSYFGS